MSEVPAALAAAARADAAFGAALQGQLAVSGGNVVFSPASIATALRMALCGARGDTAAEIAAALRLSGPQAAAEDLRQLSGAAADLAADQVTFRAPNTMWVQSGYPLVPRFTGELRDAAAVTVRDADFARAAEAARREINDLIGKQTEGKITDLVPPGVLDKLTRLVLVNAIYLKAAWAHQFPGQATGDAPFYPAGPQGPAVITPTMHLTEDLRYLRGDGYQAVLLPYRSPRLAMVIALPDGPPGSPPPDLATGLAGLLDRFRRHKVTLSLPRFRVESGFSLAPVLQKLGITRAFDRDRADFSGITDAERLHISAVLHQAYVEVDEQGTEAAAATAVTIRAMAAARPAERVTMTVDRPFLFAIMDTGSGWPLFLGQVSDPRSG